MGRGLGQRRLLLLAGAQGGEGDRSTGESEPSRRSAEASHQENLAPAERPNLVFAGTTVSSGTGRAVVFATGMGSEFGKIARLTQSVTEELSPLQREVNRLTRIVTLLAVGIGIVFFVLSGSWP